MAEIPTPRSRSQVVGSMLDTVLSRLGLPGVRVGSPALSIIESAAQSDVRVSQDIFTYLKSSSLDGATGLALDRAGADEDLPRLGETAATGTVLIGDSSFEKIQSKIFQGQPAPIIGSVNINVDDAQDFPASGSIYIGRGTTDYEGPLDYTAKIDNTNYWTLTLDSGNETQKYHQLGETVILAQGGTRNIPVGTLVQTPQGNAGTSVQFSTLYAAQIPDGEVEVGSVAVIARTPGVIGNITAGSINAFVTPPFAGATVINTLPFSNGIATENDDTYRERIRDRIASRGTGTALDVKTNAIGILALDENKRVLSASVVTRNNYPTTLYIDDGSGYEERNVGIAFETLVDEAQGGEQYFELVDGRPVSKASLEALNEAPYELAAGARLTVAVGGVRSDHDFSASDFRDIGAATAFEIVASINSNETLLFKARTVDSGKRFACSSKSDTEEDVEALTPDTDFINANDSFNIPSGRVDTLRLYKNDRLLFKDGALAILSSNPQGSWGAFSGSQTLDISVDGILIPASLSTITDADFINANTGYVTVSNTNSLDSWATVLNSKIPGITATVAAGGITLTSNRDRLAAASLEIAAGCDLVVNGMFSAGTSIGRDLDYTLDRNLGQIRLEDRLVLSTGDKLTAGSLATRAFLESTSLGTINIESEETSVSGDLGAELWIVVDGAAEIIPTGIGASTPLNVTLEDAASWGDRVRIAHTPLSSGIFENAAVGDWIVILDLGISVDNRGAWRIARKDETNGYWVEIERPTAWATPESVTLTGGNITVVRTSAEVQRIFVEAALNFTALALETAINEQILGATAAIYRTTRVRLRTNTFGTEGDITFIASNDEGRKFGFEFQETVVNETPHLAVIEAGHPGTGTPSFEVDNIVTVTDQLEFDVGTIGQIRSDSIIVALRNKEDGVGTRYGNAGHRTSIEVISGTDITTRKPVLKDWLPEDRLYAASPYALTPRDQLTVLLDEDVDSKRFVMPLGRRLTPSTSTYGITNVFSDGDAGNVSLAKTFGTDMNWEDFAVFMPARVKSHGGPDTNKTILWRYSRLGLEGNRSRLQYIYPESASQPLLVSVDPLQSSYAEIQVQLPSDAARTGINYTNGLKLGHRATALAGGLYTYVYVLNLAIGSAEREIRLNYTAGVGSLTGAVLGTLSGATGIVSSSTGTYLVLTAVLGVFTNGEPLTFGGGGTATAVGSQYGVAKLTLTLPAGITDHGFSVGNIVHVEYNGTGSGAGFITGNKNIYEVPDGTHIHYIEGITAIAATAAPGTVSYDTAEANLGASTVVSGDIFTVGADTNLPTAFEQTIKIATLTDGYMIGESPVSSSLGSTLLWADINSVDNLSWYPLLAGSSTAAAIATAVNAQVGAAVTAVAVGDGLGDNSGQILFATYEDSPDGLGGTDPWYYLSDGINWIRSHSTPPDTDTDFSFTFKEAITAALATNSDWQNEDIRITPITTTNVVDYLQTAGPGGLFAGGEIVAANRDDRPQIATLTLGSGGSVYVQGGSANGVSAGVRGSSVPVDSTYVVVTLSGSDAQGLAAGHWVRAQNVVRLPKTTIDSGTDLDSIGTGGLVIFDSGGTPAWDWANTGAAPITGLTWQIEKHGDYVAFVYVSGGSPDLSGIEEGDWVHVSAEITAATVNVRNQGLFRIIRVDDVAKIFWLENPNALEEIVTVDAAFLTYDSIVPGDQLVINTDSWGLGNLGTWTVAGIDLTTYDISNTDSRWTFSLDVTTRTPEAVITPGPGPLGDDSTLVEVREAYPGRLFKRIHGISVNPDDTSLADIKFDTQAGYAQLGAGAQTLLQSLDKLSFPVTVAAGVDGYKHGVGLIAETNRVEYGVEADSSTYPGVIAAGANVNIEGPLVHRVQVSLALRVKSDVGIADRVQSAVAAVINEKGVGENIAISEIVAAAMSVSGVVAVTILSPTYSSGNDLISIQPFEKALVLNLKEDILITFVGD